MCSLEHLEGGPNDLNAAMHTWFTIGIRMARNYVMKNLEYFQINPGESGHGRYCKWDILFDNPA